MKPITQNPNLTEAFNIGRYTEAKLDGDWHKLPALFRTLGGGSMNRGIKRDIAKALRYFALRLKSNLVAGLASEGRAIGQSWSPTGSYGGRGPVGQRSGKYLQALNNLQVKQKSYMISLTFPKGALNQRSVGGATLGQYANWFETGTKQQPPRPLWAASFRKTGGRGKIMQYVKGAVGRRLQRITR